MRPPHESRNGNPRGSTAVSMERRSFSGVLAALTESFSTWGRPALATPLPATSMSRLFSPGCASDRLRWEPTASTARDTLCAGWRLRSSTPLGTFG
eukprot:scaffold57_cov254-Pinguiococcus_pyrenoidosus.AAC.50